MEAYYTQAADKLFPIFGVSSMEEAREYVQTGEIIETSDRVLMNPNTGSVDFEGGWEETDGLVEVRWDLETEGWVEA